ncbi:MAG: FGGY-family carbohydrate kinase [Candidatus Atribacteria bacterium]|nr:FGGY-family carbohydrate kinase [Candidatus Atribacteria bacterium]
MNKDSAFVMGIDCGTQGIRCLISDLEGNIIADGQEKILSSNKIGDWFEQDPNEWWTKTQICIQKTLSDLEKSGYSPSTIHCLSLDSTSGTIIPIGENNQPLCPAIMYNDSRAKEESLYINHIAPDFTQKIGYQFDPSFALCKVLWLKNHLPEIYNKTKVFLHACDFLQMKLTGLIQSDISNSLKMGFDLLEMTWPSFIQDRLGIDIQKLPLVIKTGEESGVITKSIVKKFHFSPSLKVLAGATDGTASFFASGARLPGDISSTIGTTLVIRGISKNLIKDTKGRIYCHLHPAGYWLPGGASNTGGECLQKFFPNENLKDWDSQVLKMSLPTSLILYPLTRKGERLPFASPEAEFFQNRKESNRLEFYAACLEGVGYVEKLSYHILEILGSSPIQRVFSSGSGANSPIWCQIRSNILSKPVYLPKTTESAMGACIIAASHLFGNLSLACEKMVKINEIYEPQKPISAQYQEKYHQFLDECQKRGYIQ